MGLPSQQLACLEKLGSPFLRHAHIRSWPQGETDCLISKLSEVCGTEGLDKGSAGA